MLTVLKYFVYYRTACAWLQTAGIIPMGQQTVIRTPDPNDPTDHGEVGVVAQGKPSLIELGMLTAASWSFCKA